MSLGARFVTFEGIDGSGKSSQARLLAAALREAGREVCLTREPGGSPGAEEIRRLLVEGAGDRWSAETEVLLFTAARRDHLERTIRPALARGAVVICDRFADSTRVYQGVAGAGLRALVDELHARFIGIEPDLTLILDMDPASALARSAARQAGGPREVRFESLGSDHHVRLRAGFRALAAEFPARCRLIDATRPEVEVAAEVARLFALAEAGA
ncbi:MAG: dTMP kinase [Alphaproteobacteria bacterium HGW-Alphaproteobacteria-2]|nr:MAG: dTMP kinase [Alphaproteobacteria bacterium HGW-Alphaproteobacteria-2]